MPASNTATWPAVCPGVATICSLNTSSPSAPRAAVAVRRSRRGRGRRRTARRAARPVGDITHAAGMVGVLVGEHDMAYAGPAGAGAVEHRTDLVRAASDAGVDHRRLVAAHQHVRRHEPEVDPRPGQLARRRGRTAAAGVAASVGSESDALGCGLAASPASSSPEVHAASPNTATPSTPRPACRRNTRRPMARPATQLILRRCCARGRPSMLLAGQCRGAGWSACPTKSAPAYG